MSWRMRRFWMKKGSIAAGKIHAFAFDQMRSGYYAVENRIAQAWNAGVGIHKK